MNAHFKTCARGHFYSAALDHCPYCPTTETSSRPAAEQAPASAAVTGNRTMDLSDTQIANLPQESPKTQIFEPSQESPKTQIFEPSQDSPKTQIFEPSQEAPKTQIFEMPQESPKTQIFEPEPQTPQNKTQVIPEDSNKTMVVTEEENQPIPEPRERRKLVGWLVSYTLDEDGMDFKLYEGRNMIGRKQDCQVVIPDRTVTEHHALILFRAGKYSISDQQSTAGTFVNDEDIELDPRYLKDGDVIRIGTTILKFRSSL